jgi:hypothetical protein
MLVAVGAAAAVATTTAPGRGVSTHRASDESSSTCTCGKALRGTHVNAHITTIISCSHDRKQLPSGPNTTHASERRSKQKSHIGHLQKRPKTTGAGQIEQPTADKRTRTHHVALARRRHRRVHRHTRRQVQRDAQPECSGESSGRERGRLGSYIPPQLDRCGVPVRLGTNTRMLTRNHRIHNERAYD